MKFRNGFTVGLAIAGTLAVILDFRTAASGISEGMNLCIKGLIPSLFPFFFFSALLTGNMTESFPFLKKVCRVWNMPAGSEALLIPSFLGGYPAGAASIAQAWRNGNITRQQAEKLLAFGSNAGPAFIFGFLGSVIGNPWICWILWVIHLISAWIVSRFLPESGSIVCTESKTISASAALSNSISAIALVCGWILLFRMLLAFLQHWFLRLLPDDLQIWIWSLIELSNGMTKIPLIEKTGEMLTTISVLLSLGGLCVTIQVCSVARGLSLQYYFRGKILQASFSFFLSGIAQLLLPRQMQWYPSALLAAAVGSLCVIGILSLQRQKNSVAFPARLVYNERNNPCEVRNKCCSERK